MCFNKINYNDNSYDNVWNSNFEENIIWCNFKTNYLFNYITMYTMRIDKNYFNFISLTIILYVLIITMVLNYNRVIYPI